MSAGFAAWLNSATGPKTTHFWGPVANWGFVVAVRPFKSSLCLTVYGGLCLSEHASLIASCRYGELRIRSVVAGRRMYGVLLSDR
eukprot:671401-Pyramimonas_sp.AAC.1